MFDAATTFKEHHPALGGAEAADESANLTDAVGKAMKILQAGKALSEPVGSWCDLRLEKGT